MMTIEEPVKPKRPSFNPDGRPLIPIDEDLVFELAKIHCTNQEIADICKVSKDTLERRYAALINLAKSHGKSSLRRAQYQAALRGNTALLIWLGKCLLGQRDETVILNNETHIRKYVELLDKEAKKEIEVITNEISLRNITDVEGKDSNLQEGEISSRASSENA